jgi:hypothetical protein
VADVLDDSDDDSIYSIFSDDLLPVRYDYENPIIGQKILKYFRDYDELFLGTCVSATYDENYLFLYQVEYDDGDDEDMDKKEMCTALS